MVEKHDELEMGYLASSEESDTSIHQSTRVYNKRGFQKSFFSPLTVVALGVATAALSASFLLCRRRWNTKQRRKSSKPPKVRPEDVFSVLLHLEGNKPTAMDPLVNWNFAVSDRFNVLSVQTRFGSDVYKSLNPSSETTARLITQLQSLGATPRAIVKCEFAGQILSDDTTDPDHPPNPADGSCTHGGGEYGAAVAVGARLVDFALTIDEGGNALGPAAACGCFAIRPTSKSLSLDGATVVSRILASPCFIAKDPQILVKLGNTLRLPGAGGRSDVIPYLIAGDIFKTSLPEQPGAAAHPSPHAPVHTITKAAIKRWAGSDEVKSLDLCMWLWKAVPSLRLFYQDFRVSLNETQPDPNITADPVLPAGITTTIVLQTLNHVASVLRSYGLKLNHGDWILRHKDGVPQSAVNMVVESSLINTPDLFMRAQQVAKDIEAAASRAFQDGQVLVIPTITHPSPATLTTTTTGTTTTGTSSTSGEMEIGRLDWMNMVNNMNAFGVLAGMPQVAVPFKIPGRPVASISLLTLRRKDMPLLYAAGRLSNLLEEEAVVVMETWDRRVEDGVTLTTNNINTSAGSPSSSPSSKANNQRNKPAVNKHRMVNSLQNRQEEEEARLREAGNVAFRAGKYKEALQHYTRAIQAHPEQAAAAYSNRAMTNLKLGRYGDAEDDCDASIHLQTNGTAADNNSNSKQLLVKALLRRGAARAALGKTQGAIKDFKQVVAIEPSNRQAKLELDQLRQFEGDGLMRLDM
jgi:amidase